MQIIAPRWGRSGMGRTHKDFVSELRCAYNMSRGKKPWLENDCMTVSNFDFEGGLAACAAGDRGAFEALYEHEAPTMMALACSLLNKEDEAAELLRETFILIWRNAAGYTPTLGTGRAWMYSILRYRAQARLRDPRQAVSSYPETPPAIDPQAIQTGIMPALDRLDRVPRETILLAYCKGLTYSQIARRMRMTPEALRAWTLEALDHARKVIEA
jgi:RNA polymerase sigma-70 factor (ECF subfamily)